VYLLTLRETARHEKEERVRHKKEERVRHKKEERVRHKEEERACTCERKREGKRQRMLGRGYKEGQGARESEWVST